MPIRLDFTEHHHSIICLSFQIPWTWSEFSGVVKQVRQMMSRNRDPDHPLYLILDMTTAGHLPTGTLQNLNLVMERIQPTNGKVIIVGADWLLYSFIQTLYRISPSTRNRGDIAFTDTLEEALSLIEIQS